MTEWKRVVHADDCTECFGCGEAICPECQGHYAQCKCPGPSQDDLYHYQYDLDGHLWAMPKGTTP